MKNNNTNKGITLIALVITIIVMLILVAVTISMAINGGLFQKAGEAVGETQNKIDEEQTLANGQVTIDGKVYNSIDEYLSTTGSNTKEVFSEIYTENTTITQGEYTAVIPKGFAVGISSTVGTIAGGLVITDEVDEDGNSTGNEFVWIPLTYTATGLDTDSNGYDDGFDEVFNKESEWDENTSSLTPGDNAWVEPYEYYNGEVEEYNEMTKSVYDNSGFYIGRYEAGGISELADETVEIVVKRDCYPYHSVTFSNAKILSQSMYNEKNKGVKSTLCFGVLWLQMKSFIENKQDIVIGNLTDNAWTITRTTAKYYDSTSSEWIAIPNEGLSKTETESVLLTTGASESFATNNIYDLAGNLSELSREFFVIYRQSGYNPTLGMPTYSIFRSVTLLGTSYLEDSTVALLYNGKPLSAAYDSDGNRTFLGFRPILYIN